ncbi:hypothetical protein DDT52_06250 [Brenneria roseae subsp. roseae]|uniref:ash family protein n=1 Tax=Brenneria roseae TaxID=1509241 RepID=UPI000D6152C9|nr:hypothetical protein DDT52_06250 [Brenneria roseae subsp. roseae]
MVGWAGAPQGAPVSDEAGKTNSVQSTTRKIGLFGGGNIPYSSEAATMATTLNQTHPLLTVPFSTATDFTVLADHCEKCADTQAESYDPVLKMALCGRLAAGLALLKPGLSDPIPPHLIDSLTVDTLPTNSPRFAPDADTLCDYCFTLTQLLLCRMFPPQAEEQLRWLLAELVDYFASELKAPRWIRTADGVKCIDEEAA